jgi:hypothetical protein
MVMFVMTTSALHGQDTLADEMSTSERLAKHQWWPTKPGTANDKYVGSESCKECHAGIAKTQPLSEMARTLMPAEQSEASEHLNKPITVDGFTYEFVKTPQGLAFHLQAGKSTATKPVTWAFGSGAISQVYFSGESDSFNESHFSYFEGTHGFDVTPAQPNLRDPTRSEPADKGELSRAIGRNVTPQEGRRCFGCHAANVPAEVPMTGIEQGVTCEACHGPGGNHIAAIRAGLPQGGALITNPKHLKPVDQVDFCGACHATSIDVQLTASTGLPSVRFPAYRLQNSACWRNDARIQCTACHDVHKPMLRGTASYDERCLACHVASASAKTDNAHPGRGCPVGTKDCAGCHMPKYDFPDVHHKFTDHQIRVVRAGEPIPE